MILQPDELIAILPRMKRNGKRIKEYWRSWMPIIFFGYQDSSREWRDTSLEIKEAFRERAEHPKGGDGREERRLREGLQNMFKSFGATDGELPIPETLEDCRTWTGLFSALDLRSEQQKAAVEYENWREQFMAKQDLADLRSYLEWIHHRSPFARRISDAFEEESISRGEGLTRTLRLLATIDFFLLNPELKELWDRYGDGIQLVILKPLPVSDDSSSGESRFLKEWINRSKNGRFAEFWKELRSSDPSSARKLRKWIKGDQTPRQEELYGVIGQMTSKAVGVVRADPQKFNLTQMDEAGWQRMLNQEILMLLRLLELNVFFDAIYRELSEWVLPNEDASDILREQVEASMKAWPWSSG